MRSVLARAPRRIPWRAPALATADNCRVARGALQRCLSGPSFGGSSARPRSARGSVPRPPAMFRVGLLFFMQPSKVLVAVDGSEISSRAVTVAADVAAAASSLWSRSLTRAGRRCPKARCRPTRHGRCCARKPRGLLKVAAKEALVCPLVHRFLREGQPGAGVRASAREWGAGMIVIGICGRCGLIRLLMGSTAEAVVRHAPCPVLVIPPSSCGGR